MLNRNQLQEYSGNRSDRVEMKECGLDQKTNGWLITPRDCGWLIVGFASKGGWKNGRREWGRELVCGRE